MSTVATRATKHSPYVLHIPNVWDLVLAVHKTDWREWSPGDRRRSEREGTLYLWSAHEWSLVVGNGSTCSQVDYSGRVVVVVVGGVTIAALCANRAWWWWIRPFIQHHTVATNNNHTPQLLLSDESPSVAVECNRTHKDHKVIEIKRFSRLFAYLAMDLFYLSSWAGAFSWWSWPADLGSVWIQQSIDLFTSRCRLSFHFRPK